jgi:tRNA pseudouridine55 synthase
MSSNRRQKPKRGATNICGVLAVDKPAGMTSHDVIDALRHITGEGRIGHAGTLDPAATGLLLVCIGPATKRSEKLTGHDKCYDASICFGQATSTDDAQGEVIHTAALLPELGNADFARSVLNNFIGEQLQLPPQFAAIKTGGKKAYELARQGKTVELASRPIHIYSLELLGIAKDRWDIRASVSKGTYLRALARDIGEAVGCPAHLSTLRRTAVGKVTLDQAHSLEELATARDFSEYWLTGDILL